MLLFEGWKYPRYSSIRGTTAEHEYMRLPQALILILLTVAALPATAVARQGQIKPTRFYQLTPSTVSGGGAVVQVPNPIAHALERCGPGSVLQLTPGTYEPFSIGINSNSPHNARTSGGMPGAPITIEGQGNVILRCRDGGADTILVSQQVPNGHFLFKNLIIHPGYRAGVMFARGGVHRGFQFWDCHVIGQFDHARKTGKPSKWGIWGSQLHNFEFRGLFKPAEVRNIRDEHGFYLQNVSGRILIENVRARNLGRTFCQFTSRAGEGPMGSGTITVKNCDVYDIGLAPGDAHKGGFAFTFGGRHRGTIRIEKCVYRCGFNKRMKHLTTPGSPYGTGALVMIDAGSAPTDRLILADNDFRFHPEAGDRAVVSIGGCRDVQITGSNRFQAGAYGVAIELDPVHEESGNLKSRPNGKVLVDAKTVLMGAIELRGKERKRADLPQIFR